MQNKNALIGIGIVVVLVIIAAALYFTKSNTPSPTESSTAPQVIQQQPTNPPTSEISANFIAQNSSGETGKVTLSDSAGKIVTVNLALTGTPSGVAQPAHIHKGTCATLDPKPLYPLTNAVDGKSQTTLDNKTIAELKNEGPLAVNVHKSAQQSSVYVACADIKFDASGAMMEQSSPSPTDVMKASPKTNTAPGY